MNVIRQDIDALNGLLIVEIEPNDYAQKVKSQLEKYRKTAKIPGFRPGHTPFGVVEKRFGKAVLAEELNQLANQGINQFIREQQLEILGNPIPSAQHEVEGSFDQPNNFKFTFEIGMPSSFDYESVLKSGVEYHTVRVDDKLIEQRSGRPVSWFSVNRVMKELNCRVFWVHDQQDDITPYEDTLPTRSLAKPTIRFVQTNGLGHRRIYRDPIVCKEMLDFLLNTDLR